MRFLFILLHTVDHLLEYVKYNCNPDNFPKTVKYVSLTFDIPDDCYEGEEYRKAVISEVKCLLKNPVLDAIRDTREFKDIEKILN